MDRRFTAAAVTLGALLVVGAGPVRAQSAPTTDTKKVTLVQEQNVDARGNIKVHEQGTIAVKSALEPVQVSTFGEFLTGAARSADTVLYTVPAGKILVIDSVTIGSNMSATDRLLDVTFQLSFDGFFNVYVQPVAEGVFSGTNASIFRRTQSVTAYAGPGTQITAAGNRDGTVLSSTSILFGIAGHLTDAP